MPRNPNGTVTRRDGSGRQGRDLWDQNRRADVDIEAGLHDSHDNDLADIIQQNIDGGGRNQPTANLPMGGNKHTGVGEATAANEYATKGQLDNATTALLSAGEVGGTANAIELTPSTPVTALTAGRSFRFALKGTNTGSVTIEVSNIAAKTVKKVANYDLQANDFRSGDWVEVTYDGTNFLWTGGANIAAGARYLLTETQYDALSAPEPYPGVLYLFTGS